MGAPSKEKVSAQFLQMLALALLSCVAALAIGLLFEALFSIRDSLPSVAVMGGWLACASLLGVAGGQLARSISGRGVLAAYALAGAAVGLGIAVLELLLLSGQAPVGFKIGPLIALLAVAHVPRPQAQ